MFKDINEAYSVLSEPDKRKLFDLGGYDPSNPNGSAGFPGGANIDPNDIFKMFFGGAGGTPGGFGGFSSAGDDDIFSAFGGGSQGGRGGRGRTTGGFSSGFPGGFTFMSGGPGGAGGFP